MITLSFVLTPINITMCGQPMNLQFDTTGLLARQAANEAKQAVTDVVEQGTAAVQPLVTQAQTAAAQAANVAKDYLQRSAAYMAGDIIPAADNLSKAYALLCTTAGTTAATAPTTWAAADESTMDGTAVFQTIARRPTTRDQAGLTDIYTKTEIDTLLVNHDIFGSTFDGINSAGTRVFDSVGLSWVPSSDVVKGTDDFRTKGPFNTFEVLTKPDSNGVSKIVAYEGDRLFDEYKNDDSYGADVITIFPKGWCNRIINGTSETRLVSETRYDGYIPSPMHYRNGKLYDYIGIPKYGWCDDGNGGICSRSGKPPKINITENQFESLVRAKGMYIAGVNDMAYLQHIGCIKYNSLNWQTAVGCGISGIYAYAKATVSETGVSRIIISNSDAAKFSVGELVHITTSGTWWPIASITAYDTANMALTITSGTTFNTTSGSTTIETSCVKSGGTDGLLGVDGAVSTGKDGWRSVLTLDLENLYSNTWKLLSGACRIGTDIYINPTPDTQYTWPTSVADAVTKGWVKLGFSVPASAGWVKSFGYDAAFPLISLPSATGGDSANPVGDYYYTNADADPKIVRFGGSLGNRSNDGPFCAYLDSSVGTAYWAYGAFGVFVPV